MQVSWLPGARSVPVGPRSGLADPLGVSSQGQQCGESTLAVLGLWAPLCLVWVLPWSKKEPWRFLTPWALLLPAAILVRPRGIKGICPFRSRVLPEYGGADAQRAPGFSQLWGWLRALLPFPAWKGSSAHPYSTTSQCPWGKRRKSRLCPSLAQAWCALSQDPYPLCSCRSSLRWGL